MIWVPFPLFISSVAKAVEMQQFGEMDQLYIDGFDGEGLWEQIRLRVGFGMGVERRWNR